MGGDGSGGSAGMGGALDGGTPDGPEGGALDAGAPDIDGVLAAYRAWAPQQQEPIGVSDYLFGICRAPTLKEQQFLDSEHGNGRKLQDWANDLAVAGIARRGSPAFAEGATIVKEKYAVATSGGLDLVARGIMIKRIRGFSPATGDWDFAYWERGLGTVYTAEQTAYCGGCHMGASATDSVFVDGLKP
jgi:hypothetical protein